MPIVKTAKFIAAKVERFLVYRILSINDSPHRIALSVAIGIFITWTPTIGLQMMLTIALCFLLRANKLVGVPFVWISNPLTIVPIYAPNYIIGCWMLGRKPEDTWENIANLAKGGFFSTGWWDSAVAWFAAIKPIFVELWLGSLAVGLVLGVMTYFAVYRMIVVYRAKLKEFHEHHPRKHHDKPKNETAANDVLTSDEK